MALLPTYGDPRRRNAALTAAALTAPLLWSAHASAYSYERVVSDGCHERIGVNLIGIEWALTRTAHLIIEPGDVAISVPHLTGAPLTYRQYRFTVGVQFGD
jgi:hypothetical protein